MKAYRAKPYFTVLFVSGLLLFSQIFFGCQTQQKKITPVQMAPSCLPPSGIGLEEAMAQSKSDLINGPCQTLFDSYFQALLEIASGDPKPENKALFSDFLVWANGNGILTMVQSKEYYNRYFNDTFMALPDRYNVCSSVTKKDEMIRGMERELRQKEKGLLKACADDEIYYRAYQHYNTLLVVLDATLLACEKGKQ